MTGPHSKTVTESLVESVLDTDFSQHAQAERLKGPSRSIYGSTGRLGSYQL